MYDFYILSGMSLSVHTMKRLPHPKAPGLECAIDEEMIGRLVQAFYARVRQDEVLGPVFERHVTDWDAHLVKLCDFWSSVTLMTGAYKGRPMPVHAAISGTSDENFSRWLRLFRETAQTCCPPAAAALFIERAGRIAESLRLGIAVAKNGEHPEIRYSGHL